MRETSNDFETDLEERENKKKKMEIDEPETPGTHAQILAPRGRKRRNTTDNILLTKRRRTNDGNFIQTFLTLSLKK